MDLWGVIYPRTCPICQKVVGGIGYKELICNECAKKLIYVSDPRCKKCGKQIIDETKEYCFDCMKKEHIYYKNIAGFVHAGEITDSIYRIKYNNKREYVEFYVSQIIKQYEDEIKSWGCNEIIPVPIHKKKRIKRGYNQAEVIAKELSKHLNISLNKNGLRRVKNTLPQKELDDVQRKKNLENAFKIGRNSVKLKKIILVDDIYTTGNTIDACADILLKEGACRVYSINISIGSGY